MLNGLFNAAGCRAALVALTLFTLSTVVLGVINPKNKIEFELGDAYVPIGTTFKPRLDDIKNMLRLYQREPRYADAEKRFFIYDFGYLLIYGFTLTIILAYLLPVILPAGFQRVRWLALSAGLRRALRRRRERNHVRLHGTRPGHTAPTARRLARGHDAEVDLYLRLASPASLRRRETRLAHPDRAQHGCAPLSQHYPHAPSDREEVA
jgi:hypothetical protein